MLPTGSAAEKLKVLVSVAGLIGICYSFWQYWHCKDPSTVLHRVETRQLEARKNESVKEEDSRNSTIRRMYTYAELGKAHEKQGKMDAADAAEEMYKKALSLSADVGYQLGLAQGYTSLCMLYVTRKEFNAAEGMCQNGLWFYTNLKEHIESKKRHILNLNILLGAIYERMSDDKRKCFHWQEAVPLWRKMPVPMELRDQLEQKLSECPSRTGAGRR